MAGIRRKLKLPLVSFNDFCDFAGWYAFDFSLDICTLIVLVLGFGHLLVVEEGIQIWLTRREQVLWLQLVEVLAQRSLLLFRGQFLLLLGLQILFDQGKW